MFQLLLAAVLALFSPAAHSASMGTSPESLVLHASFDTDLHASPGAPNAYSASNRVVVADTVGANGRAAHFVGGDARLDHAPLTPMEQHALIYSGDNIPSKTGWIEFRLKTTDGKGPSPPRRWIAALPPVIGELYFESQASGLGLGLVQDQRGDLMLTLHRFGKGRLTADYRTAGTKVGMAEPDAILIRFPKKFEDGQQSWRKIRIGWDQIAGMVFLGVDDELRSADVDFPKTRFRALILGAPPKILHVRDDAGFSGYLDDLKIFGPLESAKLAPSKNSKPYDTSAIGPDSQWENAIRFGARQHLDRILETQRAGGWGPLVALPSGLHFLSAPTLLPYGDQFYFGKGRASSIVVALILLRGYEVLGDSRYLAAARAIGELALVLQSEHGTWPAQALLSTAGPPRLQNQQYAILNDRIQTMPIVLLWRLHEITGDEQFAASAARGVSFLVNAQNRSGSWPNRVVVANGRHESMSGIEGAGEINDYSTTDAMNIMLVMYRKTANVKYLSRYLQGADWLVRVFQDGPVKGWAKQYDASDCPITARHHEPIGVAFREMDDVPRTLLEAYLLTGFARYKNLLRRWADNVRSVGDKNRWYPYYDIQSGKPLKRVGGRIVPADPRERRDYAVTKSLALIDRGLTTPHRQLLAPRDPSQESKRLRRKADRLLGSMNVQYGTWLSTVGVQGPVMNPNSPRVLTMLHALANAQSISQSGKQSKRSSAYWQNGWRDEFGSVMSSATRFARIDETTLARASSLNPSLERDPSTKKLPCASAQQ